MNGHEGEGGPREFVTTRWSLIFSAANLAVKSKKLAMRWPNFAGPIGGPFSRLYGTRLFDRGCAGPYSGFFCDHPEEELVAARRRNRGRFRSLLLKSLQNFLINAAEKSHTHKRGGSVEFVSWHDWMAEAPSRSAIPLRCWSRCRLSGSSISPGQLLWWNTRFNGCVKNAKAKANSGFSKR